MGSIGLFSADEIANLSGGRRPPSPKGYKLPSIFPSFNKAKRVSIDLESHDTWLGNKLGPGWRRDAYICGFAVALGDKKGNIEHSEYYPLRHKNAPNLDAERVLDWLATELAFYQGEIVGTNLLYDFDGFQYQNVTAPLAKFRDIQWAEALIDENAFSYGLNTLAKKYLGEGKVNEELKQLYGDHYIERFPEVHPGHARAYGLGDVELPMKVLDCQQKILHKEHLEELYDLESRLLPFLLYMRREGTRVDLKKAAEMGPLLTKRRDDAIAEIAKMSGIGVNYDNFGTPAMMKRIFDKLQIPYPYLLSVEKGSPLKGSDDDGRIVMPGSPDYEAATKGNVGAYIAKPSFRKVWLEETLEHPIAELIMTANSAEKARGTFVEGYIGQNAIGDRIHCEFHPLRKVDDEDKKSKGTITGRLSAANPNLQNIPTRDPFIGPMCRDMFLPDDDCDFFSADYSQIEYRMLIHFAVINKCSGAEVPQQMYLQNPKTDFHDACAQMMYKEKWDAAVTRHLHGEISEKECKAILKELRAPAKNLNFGMCLSPEMRLLKTDLTWNAAINVKVGDHVVGFDEERIGKSSRRYRDAVVERVDVIELPCVKITTDKGEYTCSEDHVWLARGQKGMPRKRGGVLLANPYCLNWIPSAQLRPGHKIPVLCKPWETDESRDAGWLAGVFDGEGHLSVVKGYHSQLGFAQNEGRVLSEAERLLKERHYDCVVDNKDAGKKCKSLRIRGGREEAMRFIGSVRPLRLLSKAWALWEGAACWCGDSQYETVVKVEAVGTQQVVSIRTSTRTFIAEGLLSHNCYGMGVALLAEKLGEIDGNGKPTKRALEIMAEYHVAAPYIKELNDLCIKEAEEKNFITTILGRRGRFPLWQERFKKKGHVYDKDADKPRLYEEAVAAWGARNISVCGAHKALNKKLQGSAADVIKKAMVDIWESGVLNEGVHVQLTVHDELDGSVERTNRARAALEEMIHLMEVAVPLCIPTKVSCETGTSWATTH